MTNDVASKAWAELTWAAGNPLEYAASWKRRRPGGKVVGCLPMNFPLEFVDAAGGLPILLQESDDAITAGNSIFPVFYCGFTRSLVDQAVRGKLAVLDALLFVDNCVQLIGAADLVRNKLTDLPTRFFQMNPSVHDADLHGEGTQTLTRMLAEIELLCGVIIDEARLATSIALFNRNRQLLRRIHRSRAEGFAISASQMQALIKSSMIMDRAEHTRLLEVILDALESARTDPYKVRVHLSGHMCQAPKPALLNLIEDCGAVIVSDDLFHGYRFISTDVPENQDAASALMAWYEQRDNNVPCPTRLHGTTPWGEHLVSAADAAGADCVISLLVKFCEPHMLQYPEIDVHLQEEGLPHLLIETEHEGMPLESIRTRIESFFETVRHKRTRMALATS